jgi:type IV pilus assembly protein PilA
MKLMTQKLKQRLKDQRGMTLIELLAVIVILGIISAIAVPSILGLIDNSRKDAVVANAQQMVNSAKLAVAGDDTVRPAANASKVIPLKYLETKGYLETIKDPDGGSYSADGDSATIIDTAVATTKSYVQITADATGKVYTYSVFLDGSNKDIGTALAPIAENALKRSVVTP